MSHFALLSKSNPKVEKSLGLGFLTFILHLAPSWLSGFNVCPMASLGCMFACLNTAGRGGMFKRGETTNVIQKARIRKTVMLFRERDAFFMLLVADIKRAIRYAVKRGLIPVFRLNGTSDIRWETIPVTVDGIVYPNIMTAFPDVQFYDYTKIPNRRDLPANYHLTFSLSESNETQAREMLSKGMSVAVVFRTKVFPRTYFGKRTVNGDSTDLRFLDPRGVIVALSAKGRAKKETSGFVRDV